MTIGKRLPMRVCRFFDHSTKKYKVKNLKLANKQFNKSVPEKVRNFETEIPYMQGKKREEAMKTYRKLLLSTADQLIYFTRT
ncbi:hypothetical protein ACFLRN_10500 [Thermoproteota archaeon]